MSDHATRHKESTLSDPHRTGTALRLEFERTVPAAIEDVWRALTDSDDVEQYYFDSSVECSWMPGSSLIYSNAEGNAVITGEVLDVDEPNLLVHTFAFTKAGDAAAAGDKPTKVTWTLDTEDEGTRISLRHEGFAGETATWRSVEDGWEQVLDGLVLLFQDEV